MRKAGCREVRRHACEVVYLVFQLRVLRPLCLFGLLEFRSVHGDRHITFDWRETPLFDRFLAFELPPEGASGTRH